MQSSLSWKDRYRDGQNSLQEKIRHGEHVIMLALSMQVGWDMWSVLGCWMHTVL